MLQGLLRGVSIAGAGSGSSIGALDGFSPTGAWSAARQLLTSYTAHSGAFYNLTSGAVDTWYDQSGNSRNFTQISGTLRPLITATGPNSRDMLDFDGTDDFMDNSSMIFDFIVNNAGYIIAVFFADDVSTSNAPNISDNDAIWCDATGLAGVHIKASNLYDFNFDTNQDITVAQAISISTVYVVEWLHESGSLSRRINLGTTNSVASGNTNAGVLAVVRVGRPRNSGGAGYYDGKIAELVMFNSVPSSGDRDTIAQNLMTYYGAV